VDLEVVQPNDGKHYSHVFKNPFLSSALKGANKMHAARFATTL
jgi:hypothetical protein